MKQKSIKIDIQRTDIYQQTFQVTMNKTTLLKQFVDSCSHLPPQGSDTWKLQRIGRIGGSEVSTILKQNKNKTINKLIMEKLGFDVFTGNVITYWGNVFEELIRLHTQELFNCNIQETGSIPYHEGYLSYSPDGLGVVSKEALKRFFQIDDLQLDETHDNFLTLFEFKCPHSRVPTEDIPEHYRPQITIGMNIIDIMETGIFIQAVYRRCLFNQMKYNVEHINLGHFKAASCESNPIETGFIAMYSDNEQIIEYFSNIFEYFDGPNIVDGVYDISSIADPAVFENVLEEAVKQKIKLDFCFREKYHAPIFDSDPMRVACYDISLQYRAKKMLKQIKATYGEKLIGIMPYKMLDLFITPVRKHHTYIQDNDIVARAKQIIETIDHYRDNQDYLCKADVAKSIRARKL